MNKGMICALTCCMMLAAPLAAQSTGEIYKVVDEDGNVTFTDQRPSAQAEPMDLPPLSVIETEIPEPAATEQPAQQANEVQPPSIAALRRPFVAWGSAQPVPAELSARLYVDGEAQSVPTSGSVSLTLDRGEHQVFVELLDARNRRIIATEQVTFFVRQASVGFNPAAPAPRNHGP
jgi:hypothetical protein